MLAGSSSSWFDLLQCLAFRIQSVGISGWGDGDNGLGLRL